MSLDEVLGHIANRAHILFRELKWRWYDKELIPSPSEIQSVLKYFYNELTNNNVSQISTGRLMAIKNISSIEFYVNIGWVPLNSDNGFLSSLKKEMEEENGYK